MSFSFSSIIYHHQHHQLLSSSDPNNLIGLVQSPCLTKNTSTSIYLSKNLVIIKLKMIVIMMVIMMMAVVMVEAKPNRPLLRGVTIRVSLPYYYYFIETFIVDETRKDRKINNDK